VQDRLILPDTHRRLINALVSNLDALRDESEGPDKSKILKNKAKSSVILNYGPPGTGKTLSAEVYAETIKRPLYEVPAAQIGSDPETIETNMRDILTRSLRLKMPLLINEADAFVGARGKSLELDQVVAVFLRLLEYHTGLIFLTTNRDQDIDDAIKSRCIALIEFKAPARKERLQLWKVQLTQFNLELSKQDLLKAVRAFPNIVGRDIQNLIKLTNRAGIAAKEEFNFENLRHYALFRGIKVLTDEEMAAERAAEEAAKATK
jgi:AAA+ superfamily predicted ATPase